MSSGVHVPNQGEQDDVAEPPVPARLRHEEVEDGGQGQDGGPLP